MKILITGATGMVGSEVLKLCIASDKVDEIVSLVRNDKNVTENHIIKTFVINDFNTYDAKDDLFQNIDVAFFCLGVYTGQVPKAILKEITVDYAVNFAKRLFNNSPDARLCLLSGAGADRTEKSRTAFAKFKGMAENQITAIGGEFYTFRPAYIYPVTPRKGPNFFYSISRTLFPLIKLLGNKVSVKSTQLAEAMFTVGINGANQEVFENNEIIQISI